MGPLKRAGERHRRAVRGATREREREKGEGRKSCNDTKENRDFLAGESRSFTTATVHWAQRLCFPASAARRHSQNPDCLQLVCLSQPLRKLKKIYNNVIYIYIYISHLSGRTWAWWLIKKDKRGSEAGRKPTCWSRPCVGLWMLAVLLCGPVSGPALWSTQFRLPGSPREAPDWVPAAAGLSAGTHSVFLSKINEDWPLSCAFSQHMQGLERRS